MPFSFHNAARVLAVAAVLSAACSSPSKVSAAPTVQFLVPVEGGAMWGKVQGPPNCIVTGSNISRVQFYLNDVLTNTDGEGSNGFGCWIDTTKYPDGAYVLKAVASDSSGARAIVTRNVTIKNSGAPAVSGSRPAVAFQAPDVGGPLTGNVQGPPQCVVTGYNIARVMFYVDGTWLNTDGNLLNGLGCWIDTTKYAPGSYTIRAVAYSSSDKTSTVERLVSIGGTTGGGTDPGTNPGATIPTGGKAIATFESLGLYWTPPSNPGAAGCQVRFRNSGDSAWRDGLNMWFDARNSECRGSLVHLTPATDYEVQFSLPGQTPAAQLTARTWAENLPIAQTVYVSSGSQQLNITQGGSASGYVLYTPAPGTQATLDAANAADYNIRISAPYVIVRGLTLKGARIDAIHMVQGARDIVIEDNDISGWGRFSHVNADGWNIGMGQDSAIKAYCGSTPWLERAVIQRNRIHHPRYGSSSWSDGHPQGPNALYFQDCGGNHVFRYNEVYSEWGRYFMDAFGGASNFSTKGMPNSDSDLYGNLITHVWDDAIEAEGANRNVRIWGNYTDETMIGVATTSTDVGPVYIFRNVMNRSRSKSQLAPDDDDELGRAFSKSGSPDGHGGGRRYVFHNTLLQAPPPAGSIYTSGAGIGLKGNANQPMTNTVSRNNIYHIRKSWLSSIDERGAGWGNDLDYDLFNGGVIAYAGAEANGIVGTPMYELGHGWESGSLGLYQLAPASSGYDRGARIPNFNDGFTGAGPDIGAHEAGTAAMRFGLTIQP